MQANGRVSKKGKKDKSHMISWKKRRRQASALERSENLKEILDTKVEKSLVRHGRVEDRKKSWEEVNRKIGKELNKNKAQPKSVNPFDLLNQDSHEDINEEWEDISEDEMKDA